MHLLKRIYFFILVNIVILSFALCYQNENQKETFKSFSIDNAIKGPFSPAPNEYNIARNNGESTLKRVLKRSFLGNPIQLHSEDESSTSSVKPPKTVKKALNNSRDYNASLITKEQSSTPPVNIIKSTSTTNKIDTKLNSTIPLINTTAPNTSESVATPVAKNKTTVDKEQKEDFVNNLHEVHNVTVDDDMKNKTASALDDKAMLKPGAKKRGLIVFGTLGLFSICYLAYKIYRKKKQHRENDSLFHQNDNQQFKYGVLLSNDHDDNLELTNMPLTADSDDEEMEIFDLEQKKYLENNGKRMYDAKSHLLAKEDVEILDLELPGTSDGNLIRSNRDDFLLNLDDSRDVAVIENSVTSKSSKNDNFFDVL